MSNELTPNEARHLDKMRRYCEKLMQDDVLKKRTSVLAVYQKIMSTIESHTEQFMQTTVYSVPGVLPPSNF